MKKEYCNPDVEIIRFCLSADVLDIVNHSSEQPATSGDLGGNDNGGIDLDGLGGL